MLVGSIYQQLLAAWKCLPGKSIRNHTLLEYCWDQHFRAGRSVHYHQEIGDNRCYRGTAGSQVMTTRPHRETFVTNVSQTKYSQETVSMNFKIALHQVCV
jgi:hypothetical protein